MENPKFIILIGTSAGRLKTVNELMAQVTEEVDAAIFLVMHAPGSTYTDLIIQRLERNAVFTGKVAEHIEPIRSRHFYLAAPDRHLIIKQGKILSGTKTVMNSLNG